jgi:zinc protease
MKIAAVNAAEVQQMAERHLAPDRMVIVIAGDRAKVEPELKKLELGTVEAQDVDGKPIVEQKAAGGGM